MPKNRKHAIKKTKYPNRFTITERTVLFGGFIMLALLFLAVITFSLWQHYTIQPQKRRLDATAEDLKAVHDELVKTLPNVKSEGFEKSCGQAGSVGTGDIVCGSKLYVHESELSDATLITSRARIKKTLEDEGFRFLEYKQSINTKFEEGFLDESTIKSDSGVACTLSEHRNDSSSGKEYIAYVYCNEMTPRLLDGYPKIQ